MNKKLLPILSLGLVATMLASCNNNELATFTRPKRLIENLGLTDALATSISKVYADDATAPLVINDPATDPARTQVSSLKLNVKSNTLFYSSNKNSPSNEEYQLQVKVLPSTIDNPNLKWTSSDSKVASVSNNGLVKALSAGTTTITVSTQDGSINDSCFIVVNDSNVSSRTTTKTVTKILETQSSADFVVPEPFAMSQRFVETRFYDNKITSSNDDTESMWFSESEAYFRITSEATETLVEGGSVIPSRVDYIFYTTDSYDTYCLNQYTKHKLIIDQSHLARTKDRFGALCEVLDSFFVSGSGIVTKLKSDLTGYNALSTKEYSGNTAKIGSLGETSGQFAYYKETSGGGLISAKDEEDLGIPAGTQATIEDKVKCSWIDNLVSTKTILEKISYKIDGIDGYLSYDITYQYDTKNVELLYPDIAKYTAVADIFEF